MTTTKRQFLAVVFFISGFSGLAYQVIWTRMAFACFGIIMPVLSVVLSVYMLGLAAGAWAGGRWIGALVKRSKWSALFFYGAAEALIGVGAFAAPRLLKAGAHTLLSAGQMDSGQYLLASAVALTVAILPWCLFMGTTFPFMMAYVREEADAEAESFSFLYAANVLGAMTGCLLTAVVLVEELGFAHALWVAAGGNFLIALASILTAARTRPQKAPTNAPAPAPVAPAKTAPLRAQTRGIAWILFTTGFVSMAMEVVWTRTFTPVLKTAVYAFAMVVFTYLGATFAGSWYYRRNLRQGKILTTPALLAALVIATCLPIVAADPRLTTWVRPELYFISMPSVAAVLASICPFCAALGYLTPSLIDEYAGGHPQEAGQAYGLNVLGCILGPLFASYLLLPWIKEGPALLILSAPLFAIYLFNLRYLSAGKRIITALAAGAVVIWAAFFAQDFEAIMRKFRGRIETRRDYAASVIAYGQTRTAKGILVNGIGMTTLTPITKCMVHMPLAMHRGPVSSALIICFGMGTSYRSALSWGLETTAVELIPSVPKEFGYFHADAAEVLRNPKGRIVIDDGRRFLERTDSLYDVIVIDPPPPVVAAGSSLLYSREFYDAAKPHLRTNGILETWFPAGEALTALAIYRSLKESFPHVRSFQSIEGWGMHFVASMEPIDTLTPEQAATRLPPLAKKDLLEWSQSSDAAQYLAPAITNEYVLPELSKSDPWIAITDDHPFNEYFLLRELGWSQY